MYDVRAGPLNATMVGRREYAPGSTAFLVYSHAQIPSEDGTTFDLRSLPRGPSQKRRAGQALVDLAALALPGLRRARSEKCE
jgi:hypothetical protein